MFDKPKTSLSPASRWLWVPVLAVFIACATALGYAYLGARTIELYLHGAQTAGEVTGDPAVPTKAQYQFEVAGKKYTGAILGATKGMAEWESKHPPGSPIQVFYLPRNPEISSLGDPAQALRDFCGLVTVMALAGVVMIWQGRRILGLKGKT